MVQKVLFFNYFQISLNRKWFFFTTTKSAYQGKINPVMIHLDTFTNSTTTTKRRRGNVPKNGLQTQKTAPNVGHNTI